MSGVQCQCGRFLARPHGVLGRTPGDYGDWCLADVRGDCSRCGPDVQATREGDMASVWWSWEAWKWPPEIS